MLMLLVGGRGAAAEAQLEACGILGSLQAGENGAECSGRMAGGSDYDAAQCPTAFDPWAGLTFDDDLHRRWYARFWSGQCEGFGFLDMCIEDGNNWPGTVAFATRDVPVHDLARARAEWNALGRMIGFEWARRNNVRRISTGELKKWRDIAQSRGDTWSKLRAICDRAQRELEIK